MDYARGDAATRERVSFFIVVSVMITKDGSARVRRRMVRRVARWGSRVRIGGEFGGEFAFGGGDGFVGFAPRLAFETFLFVFVVSFGER